MVLRLGLMALIGLLTAGCPASTGGFAHASASAVAAAADLSVMTVDQLTLYRDGGTMVAKGRLPDGTALKVRMDGAMGSDTRGIFFITRGEAPERRLLRAESEGLITAVDRDAKAAGSTLDPRVVEPFLEKLRAFQSSQ
jgi:hypothetical protein